MLNLTNHQKSVKNMQNKEIVSLYSDFRELSSVNLPDTANQKLATYLDEIHDGVKQSSQSQNPEIHWFQTAKNLIKKIIIDTFEVYGIDNSKINFQFYISGSLAKGQATPYSDFDGFIIWEDPKGNPEKQAEIEKIKLALNGMNNLFQRIFESTNQFCPDPLGITPFNYHGTPDELFSKIANKEVADVAIFLNSIATARPLMAETSLLQELTDKISDLPEAQGSAPKKLYQSVVHDYPGPSTKNDLYLKRDIFRPLDFFLMALRNEQQISFEDGSHLVSVNTINELMQKGIISYEFGDLLLSIFKDAIKLRFMNHIEAHSENDKIAISEMPLQQQIFIKNLIDKMAIVRGVAKERLDMLDNDEDPAFKKIELTSITAVPYQSKSYVRNEMTLDISPFVFTNSAREYFENQRSIIRQNLIQADFQQEGGFERVFQGIQQTPQHLSHLSSQLTECFEQDNDSHLTSSPVVFNSDKFSEWCNLLFQTAVGDLFDNKGSLHPWIKKVLVAGKPCEILLDENNFSSPEAKKMKSGLLNAYIANLASEIIVNNPTIQSLREDEKSSEIWLEINRTMKDTFTASSLLQVDQLTKSQDVHYSHALIKFDLVISDSIELLKLIKINTHNEKVIASIDERIAKYQQLSLDIHWVAKRQSENSEATKSSYLHKAYTHFFQDFNAFEKQFKSQERGLWVRFREIVGYIKQTLSSVVTHTKIQKCVFSEKAKKLANFIEHTEHDFKMFSNIAATKSEISGAELVNPIEEKFS